MSSAISHQDLSDLIGRIYDCTLDPSRWDATLDAIRGLLLCPNAHLVLIDLRQHRFLIHKVLGVDPVWIERQNKHLPEINQFIEENLDDGLSMDKPLVLTRT